MTETLHLLQNAIDVWHHVFALDHDGSVGAVPESHVEHSTALCVHKETKTHSAALWHQLLLDDYND